MNLRQYAQRGTTKQVAMEQVQPVQYFSKDAQISRLRERIEYLQQQLKAEATKNRRIESRDAKTREEEHEQAETYKLACGLFENTIYGFIENKRDTQQGALPIPGERMLSLLWGLGIFLAPNKHALQEWLRSQLEQVRRQEQQATDCKP